MGRNFPVLILQSNSRDKHELTLMPDHGSVTGVKNPRSQYDSLKQPKECLVPGIGRYNGQEGIELNL